MLLIHWAGIFFAGPSAWRIRERRCLAKRELQRAKSVPQRAGMVVADLRRGSGNQAGKSGDQLARFVEVDVGRSIRPVRKPEFHRSRTK
jgi:hypothetical protein